MAIMDFSKYPLERTFYLVTGTIPGLVALLIYCVSSPRVFKGFMGSEYLGYRMKLGVILLIAFVVGNSLMTFFAGIIGGIAGGMASVKPYRSPASFNIAPWRDPRWRTALKDLLGEKAPRDSVLLTESLFRIRSIGISAMPEAARKTATAELSSEKLQSEMDDTSWHQWYEHYKEVVLNPEKREFEWYVQKGVTFSLQTTAVYVLIAAVFVPGIRHWWSILPSLIWLLLAIAEFSWTWRQYNDPWLTLPLQMKVLLAAKRQST